MAVCWAQHLAICQIGWLLAYSVRENGQKLIIADYIMNIFTECRGERLSGFLRTDEQINFKGFDRKVNLPTQVRH